VSILQSQQSLAPEKGIIRDGAQKNQNTKTLNRNGGKISTQMEAYYQIKAALEETNTKVNITKEKLTS
jgi:hypothetical protein